MYSYNVEQARGDDGHNFLTDVAKDKSTDLHGAIDWLEEHTEKVIAQFLGLSMQSGVSLSGVMLGEGYPRTRIGIWTGSSWLRCTGVWYG